MEPKQDGVPKYCETDVNENEDGLKVKVIKQEIPDHGVEEEYPRKWTAQTIKPEDITQAAILKFDNFESFSKKRHRKIKEATQLPLKTSFDEDIELLKIKPEELKIAEIDDQNYEVLAIKLSKIDQNTVQNRKEFLEMKCLLDSYIDQEWAESQDFQSVASTFQIEQELVTIQNADKLMSVEAHRNNEKIEELILNLDESLIQQAKQIIAAKGKKLEKVAFLQDSEDDEELKVEDYETLLQKINSFGKVRILNQIFRLERRKMLDPEDLEGSLSEEYYKMCHFYISMLDELRKQNLVQIYKNQKNANLRLLSLEELVSLQNIDYEKQCNLGLVGTQNYG